VLHAEILTVGAELLAGDILDTNARDLARAFKGLGIAISRHVTVGDNVEEIAAAVREAMARADIVIVTGGLGPTPDDMTRDGIARAFGVGRTLREELLPEMRAIFATFGHATMPETNLTQAMLPEGAVPVHNPAGTAPGFRMEVGGSVLFSVPGIPREMRAILEESILPWLRDNRPATALHTHVLKTIGIGESELIARFQSVFNTLIGVDLAFYPQLPGVNLKLTALGDDAAAADARMAAAEAVLREHLKSHIYGAAEDTLQQVVGELLVQRGWTVATAESCTGGAIAAMLTLVPGASRYMDRGVVAYSNRAKVELLGVPAESIERHGAVSEEVARAMAEGLREGSGVDVVIATTGIAGPTGGTAEKPVGLVYSAIAAPDGTRLYRSTYPGTRDVVIRRSVMTELNRLRLVLLGER
jgi:nicotinamide-nucleotide amidase